MAKWRGKVGFAVSTETERGVWQDTIVEHTYYGDLLKNFYRNSSTDSVNDNVVISNEVSFVADPFANNNIDAIRYVEFAGIKWKVNSIEINYPRISLRFGDVYK